MDRLKELWWAILANFLAHALIRVASEPKKYLQIARDLLWATLAGLVANLNGYSLVAASWLIRRAADRLPEPQRSRYREEWLAHLDEVSNGLRKLLHGLDCFCNARKVVPDSEGRALLIRKATRPLFSIIQNATQVDRQWPVRMLGNAMTIGLVLAGALTIAMQTTPPIAPTPISKSVAPQPKAPADPHNPLNTNIALQPAQAVLANYNPLATNIALQDGQGIFGRQNIYTATSALQDGQTALGIYNSLNTNIALQPAQAVLANYNPATTGIALQDGQGILGRQNIYTATSALQGGQTALGIYNPLGFSGTTNYPNPALSVTPTPLALDRM